MPQWECIEDASSIAPTVWLSREKDDGHWKPLRKVDCRALNESSESFVLIEGGRATADKANNIIRYNFYNSPSRKMTRATWFTKEEKNSKEFVLHPMSAVDSSVIEEFYQKVLRAASSLGDGVSSVLKEEFPLEDDSDYKVIVSKTGSGALVMKKRLKRASILSFDTPLSLQRGYGHYVVEGEEEELALGPCTHLVFVVHGIGEAMWSREDVNMPSLIQEVDRTRATIHKKQVEGWKKECEKNEKAKKPLPPRPNRIELLPIEWYDKIHSSSSALMKSLNAATLRSIPALRAIANDVVFDVLMYLTPEFCEQTLDCVTSQINDLFHGFHTVHTDFTANGGKCSLVGHSLGSVIVWDLLSVLKDNASQKEESLGKGDKDDPITIGSLESLCGYSLSTVDSSAPEPHRLGYQAYASKEDLGADSAKNGSWGPSLPKRMTKTIPFIPHFTLLLGSPLGLFLTLRGAHAVFDEMRVIADSTKSALAKSASDADDSPPPVFNVSPTVCSPFCLPTGSLYNIFHPSDPVAYRIEPLLLPENVDESELPAPAFLVAKGNTVRLHVKARQTADNFMRSFSGMFSKAAEAADAAAACANDKRQLDNVGNSAGSSKRASIGSIKDGPLRFDLGGKSNRVDFALQPGVVESEYLSAVTAHASYFANDDVLEFLTQLAIGGGNRVKVC